MKNIKLFRTFGIDIQLHYSWWFIFLLLIWSLSTSLFPTQLPDQKASAYWIMGIIAAVCLFLSVLLHELSHSLVAKLHHLNVESITLFFFGGVAGISREDLQPKTELSMALAGPIFSLALAGIFYEASLFISNIFVQTITTYLYQLNLVLGLFNLIPGYPLDGGRAFRAILYAYYKDLRKATKIASLCGRIVAVILILLGVVYFIQGGLWFILLGGFLYFIAGASYEQVVVKDVLSKLKVRELMHQIPTLNPKSTFSEFVSNNVDRDQETFLVKDKTFSGILEIKKLNKMPLEEQRRLTLKQLAIPLKQVKSVDLSENGYTAFRTLSEQNMEVVPVKQKSKLVGFITKNCLMHHLIWVLKYGIKPKAGKYGVVAKSVEKKK